MFVRVANNGEHADMFPLSELEGEDDEPYEVDLKVREKNHALMALAANVTMETFDQPIHIYRKRSCEEQSGEPKRQRLRIDATADSIPKDLPTSRVLLEEQAREAQSYQKDVDGPTVPLTAEVLRTLQQRNVGASRSSQSFRSRDESGYINSTI